MFSLFDVIHFNSRITQQVYEKHLGRCDSSIIPITHAEIADNRTKREFDNKILKLIFIGGTTPYKGLPLLEKLLLKLYHQGIKNWSLDIWGSQGTSSCELIRYNGRYDHWQLHEIYHHDSLLVVPSLWNETFSLVTLEALSYGIPVLLSGNVGAKDLVEDYDPWFVYQRESQLEEKIKELLVDRSKLRTFNTKIINSPWQHSLEQHTKAILELYKKI
ncbi:MAG: glycosyltransferase [Rikenellaceae bacterium]